jgi:hypothetical protein
VSDAIYTHDAELLTAWIPSTVLPADFDAVLAKAKPAIEPLDPGYLFPQAVFGPSGHAGRIDVLAAYSVNPHVDLDFQPWTVLYVLEHGEAHALHTADHVCRGPDGMGRVPRSRPQWHVPVTVGQAILFNGHRAHWLTKPARKRLFIAASFSFENRPDRTTVEDRMRLDLDRYRVPLAA